MEEQKNKELAGKKILIVDDEPDILYVVKIILERAGCTVYAHTTGLHVEDIVSTFLPDLVLLDIGLPDVSGTEVCSILKKIHAMPIIFFSAHSTKLAAYKECNADGFIQKPFDVKELVTIIKSYFLP